jgi:hypothetical protein
MLEYLDGVNGSDDQQQRRVVYRAAERMAWECIRSKFRPGRGKQECILSEAGPEAVSAEMMTDFEKRLCIIECGRDLKFQFLLDPLAEYLAALYLVRENRSDSQKWGRFLTDATGMPGAPNEIVGFLIAVSDSIAWKESDYGIPSFVLAEINQHIHCAREQVKGKPQYELDVPMPSQQESILVS